MSRSSEAAARTCVGRTLNDNLTPTLLAIYKSPLDGRSRKRKRKKRIFERTGTLEDNAKFSVMTLGGDYSTTRDN